MTSELNRAIKHLQLIHGNSFNPFKAAPELLVKEMQAKAYLDETIYINIKNDPVEWYKQELRSISYPEAGQKNFNQRLRYSINLISQAFSKETNPYVKLFAIKECVERFHKEIPIRIFLKGISREQSLDFLQYYIEPLRNKTFILRFPQMQLIKFLCHSSRESKSTQIKQKQEPTRQTLYFSIFCSQNISQNYK